VNGDGTRDSFVLICGARRACTAAELGGGELGATACTLQKSESKKQKNVVEE